MRSLKYYGEKLPNTKGGEVDGRLIVIEGPDGSGRTTQVDLIKNWLEAEGYAVMETGLDRSPLVGADLERAMMGNTMGKLTMSLFYATDFADQFENIVIPALRAGYIVLADRYIYTLMARAIIRGMDRDWIKSLYGYAVVPDLIFSFRVAPQTLLERNFTKQPTLDYWESGFDMGLSQDMFESFFKYQALIRGEFKHMTPEYGFVEINCHKSVQTIFKELKRRIRTMLKEDGTGKVVETSATKRSKPPTAHPTPSRTILPKKTRTKK